MNKTNLDIIKEERYGKKGYNVVAWTNSGGSLYPHGGWVEKGGLSKIFPKERYKYRTLKEPHGHFGIPFNIKTKSYEYKRW